MKRTIAFLLLTASACIGAGVPWLYVQTHSYQGDSPWAITPLVAELGVGGVRDDAPWSAIETVKGVYTLPSSVTNWITVAQQNGLNAIMDCPGGNPLYANPYDPVAAVNFFTWLAGELKKYPNVLYLEVFNEPNNDYAQSQTAGGDWRVHYHDLLNSVADAVHAVNPDLKVIGLGGNPPDNYYMMSLGLSPNIYALTDHPYGWDIMQSYAGFSGFAYFDNDWLNHCAQYHVTTNRFWTEFGMSTYTLSSGFQVTQFDQAKWEGARIIEGFARNVTLQCKYEMKDIYNSSIYSNEGNFGLIRDLTPKLAYYTYQRVIAQLATLTPSSVWPYTDSTPLNFDWNYRAYGFDAADGSKSVVAFWDASHGPFFVRMKWNHPKAKSITLIDPVMNTQTTYPLNYPYGVPGDTVEMDNVPVTDSPQYFTIQ